MRGPTHALFGLTTLAVVNAATEFVQPHLVSGLPTGPALCTAAAVLGALLPDIDAHESTIKGEFGAVGDVISVGIQLLGIKHRGVIHSGLATLVVLMLAGLFGWQLDYLDVGLALGLGYASHVLLADAMTISGVPLLWPLKWQFHLLPKGLRIRTGGPVEGLVFILVAGLLVWLLPTLFPLEALWRWVQKSL